MDYPLSEIKGIGKARLKAFEAAGIRGVRDLLNCLPVDYRDLQNIMPLSLLREGDAAAVRVRVLGGVNEFRKGRLTVTRARIVDDSGEIGAVWYNQPWIKGSLAPGRELTLYGKLERRGGKLQMSSPTIETGEGLEPIYRNIPGIPRKVFADTVGEALKIMQGQWPDELPEQLRRQYRLCERNYAMLNAHRPADYYALSAARRRLAFEELLIFQVALWTVRGGRSAGVQIDADDADAFRYWDSLKYRPTGAQRRVTDEILADLRAEYPMARMVQGDVGSGKTAIAFAAMYAAVMRGWQCALMAPTEVLAAQHYESALEVLGPLGVKCGLLTGSMTAKQHRQAHEAIRSGEWRAAIGTHALITENVEYQNLGLVITDEQHRFGVRQRTLLSEKGSSPNVLVMSATPIPRSLSLVLYGDLDISIVDEMPPGRTPVKTSIVREDKRMAMYGFIRGEVNKGRQAYVVCPLVEESEAVDANAAETHYEKLRSEWLSDLRVGMVHGRMRPAEKQAVLDSFYSGDIDVLVSTTVIEVGVNVPNASVMVIENAERFGLAQLHQLRGRVGRGSEQSWCFLMAEPNERLKLLTRTNDGFIIAQKDLEIRGPGDIIGYRQSGALLPGAGALYGDTALLKETHDAARLIVRQADSPESRAVIALADELLRQKFGDVAMN